MHTAEGDVSCSPPRIARHGRARATGRFALFTGLPHRTGVAVSGGNRRRRRRVSVAGSNAGARCADLVAGESAGGGLALALATVARDTGLSAHRRV
jgi:hypothetical protein